MSQQVFLLTIVLVASVSSTLIKLVLKKINKKADVIFIWEMVSTYPNRFRRLYVFAFVFYAIAMVIITPENIRIYVPFMNALSLSIGVIEIISWEFITKTSKPPTE